MIDDLRTGEFAAELQAEVCVVGAGAAGVTIALELAGRGRQVLLLEAGGETFDPVVQAFYEGENVGHPMPLDEGRYRVFGGSTTRWTGRCAAFDPIDFAERSWLTPSGWPIGPADLAPYYPRAATYCGFATPWLDAAAALAAAGPPPPAFDPEQVTPFVWRYAPSGVRNYPDFGRDNAQALRASPQVRVLLNAAVTRFHAAPGGGRLEAVTARTLTGRAVRVKAGAFVLACGGLENARLLLASEEDVPGGLAGASQDLVGRFFMQHPRGRIATVATSEPMARRLQDAFNVFATRRPPQYEVGFALAEAAQRREGLLNASAILTYDADPDSGWDSLKTGLRALPRRPLEGVGAIARALTDPADIARNAWRRGVEGRHPVVRARQINLVIDLEQAPDPDSRVTLADQRDPLGMRRARVDWRLAELERTTSRRFAELLKGEFERLGLGALSLEPWLFERGPIGEEALSGTFHHIATTRMSADPRQGVVDADCRVHGTENLYLSGCSVFSTGGHANPTLTIVALALRLADHLAQAPVAAAQATNRAPHAETAA